MRTRTLTRAFAVAAALVVVAGTAAGAAGPASALSATGTSGGPETRTAVAGSYPPAARPPTSAQTAAATQCMDRVVYTIDASAIAPKLPTVCIAVGGVLRIAGLGPGGLSAVIPSGKADCFYGGGVTTCRLIETGTVRFRITNSQETREQTVVVAARATQPRLPSACINAEMVIRDAADTGMGWNAICVHLGIMVRFTGLGSAGFSVNPSDAVECWDDADGRYCSANRPATVRFTVTRPGVANSVLTVVYVA